MASVPPKHAEVSPTVVVLHVEDETGTDVAERIAATVGYPLPTILLTGNLSNAEVPWMPGAPIMMASKPMDGAQLIETVQSFSALHRSALARRAARAHS